MEIDSEAMEQSTFDLERRLRHLEACNASDIAELRRNLSDAAQRFADLADLIEKGDSDALSHVGFMRASARRYARVAKAC